MATTDKKDEKEAPAKEAPAKTAPAASPTDLTKEEEAEIEVEASNPVAKANFAGIGVVDLLGRDARYIGLSPGREGDKCKGPDGQPCGRYTFASIDGVPFNKAMQIKDPASGTYYFPPDGCTSWAECNLDGAFLIPEGEDAELKAHLTETRKAAKAAGN
jgi:hypothetical protein